MKDEKNIRVLAGEVIRAEEALRIKQDVKQNQKKIEDIISSLSIPEILELNDYVISYFKNWQNKNFIV